MMMFNTISTLTDGFKIVDGNGEIIFQSKSTMDFKDIQILLSTLENIHTDNGIEYDGQLQLVADLAGI